MKTAGITELKANLSSYLKKVKAGQEVVITERGLPVARLVPLEGEVKHSARIQRLMKEGVILPGGTEECAFPPRSRAILRLELMSWLPCLPTEKKGADVLGRFRLSPLDHRLHEAAE